MFTDTKILENIERNSIVRKMELEARVIFKEDGTACDKDDLVKFDLPTLKVLARNAQSIPTTARAIYSGGKPEDTKKFVDAGGKPLTGDALVEAGFEAAGYNDINKMIHMKPTGLSF